MTKDHSVSASLEIRLLGRFRILVGGVAVEERRWSRRKAQLLVKLLALQPHHQLHREQIMELLWPDVDPAAAANNLHKIIHAARRALEPELTSGAESQFILTQGQQVLLRAPETLRIDVDVFEQQATEALKSSAPSVYDAALALYEGDLLVEDLYEDWAATRREQLRLLHHDLLAKADQLYETQGRYQQSIERLKELVACDSSNEAAHRSLMKLYALTGSRRQALRQYQHCCEALRRDLDAEPERATVELYNQIVAERIQPAPKSRDHAPSSDTAINSLAILPLANAGDDPSVEYLSDGITESIIRSLSQLSQLRVMAHSTVFRYKGREVDPQQVGRDLQVRAVLTGRVLQLGDRLIISTELVDVTDGAQLWGEQFNREFADIFAVHEEISKEITEKLQLRLSSREKQRLAKRHTENSEAYRLYLRGRYLWNKRTVEGLGKAIEYFQQALAIDANYGLAHAGLSDAYAFLGDIGVTAAPPKEAFAKATMAAKTALEIDDTLAEAHASLAHLHMHDYQWSEAEREFKRALELSPSYANAHHWYAYYLLMTGRFDEAMTEIELALQLDPLSLPINSDIGDLLYYGRQYDQAIERSRRALELDPHYFRVHRDLGRSYLQKGLYDEAISEFLQAKKLTEDNPVILAMLGHAYAVSGKKEEAAKLLEELQELSKRKYVSSYDVAMIYVGLGDNDQAFERLEQAYKEQAAWLIYLTVDPRLDSLRADPRFVALVERVGLAAF